MTAADFAALPPIEMRGTCALRLPDKCVNSVADSDFRGASRSSAADRRRASNTCKVAARAVEHVMSPKRSSTLDTNDLSGGDSSDDGVSQFTASTCSTVRGFGYANQDSTGSSARGPIIGGHRSRRSRRRSRRESEFSLEGVCCPRGHELIISDRNKHWFCHGCGRVSSSCQMQCFRCHRCNYNLCDTCYSNQIDDAPEPPFWPPRQSRPSSGSPTSVDDVISRPNDDRALPFMPPAFSRGLSPPADSSPGRTGTADSVQSDFYGHRPVPSGASTGLSWMSRSGGSWNKKSSSPPPWEGASSKSFSRRSSSSSMTSTRISTFQADPMLRVVSLSSWIAESGLFNQALGEYAAAAKSGGDTSVAVKDLAEMMVKGHSIIQGSPRGSMLLDRAALEQLNRLSRVHSLPLEDVHRDLRIWQLTLHRRPERKKINLDYGRVIRRQDDGLAFDPSLFAGMGKDGGFGSHGGQQGAGAYDYSGSGGFGAGGGHGPGGINGQDGFGADASSFDLYGLGGGPLGADGRPLGSGELGPDGNPLGASGMWTPRTAARASGEFGSGDEGMNDDGTASRPDSGGGLNGEAGDQSGKSKGSRSPNKGGQTKADKAGGKNGAGDEAVGLTAEEEEALELERLLASGAIFRVKKKIAEEVILDEFANMLLPPPPLSALAGDRDSDADEEEGKQKTPSWRKKVPSSASNPAGVKSNLAEDFRKCVREAFARIDFPDEAREQKAEEDEIAAFLRDDEDDPEMKKWLSRSNTSVQVDSNSSFLETHLKMRAEKRGRRLQLQGEKALHNTQDCWSRRLQGCNQALHAISALDRFAMMRARAALGTA